MFNVRFLNTSSFTAQFSTSSASFPSGGNVGDILVKTGTSFSDVEWVAPANQAQQNNTLPITSAAVYTEIGNINSILQSI